MLGKEGAFTWDRLAYIFDIPRPWQLANVNANKQTKEKKPKEPKQIPCMIKKMGVLPPTLEVPKASGQRLCATPDLASTPHHLRMQMLKSAIMGLEPDQSRLSNSSHSNGTPRSALLRPKSRLEVGRFVQASDTASAELSPMSAAAGDTGVRKVSFFCHESDSKLMLSRFRLARCNVAAKNKEKRADRPQGNAHASAYDYLFTRGKNRTIDEYVRLKQAPKAGRRLPMISQFSTTCGTQRSVASPYAQKPSLLAKYKKATVMHRKVASLTPIT